VINKKKDAEADEHQPTKIGIEGKQYVEGMLEIKVLQSRLQVVEERRKFFVGDLPGIRQFTKRSWEEVITPVRLRFDAKRLSLDSVRDRVLQGVSRVRVDAQRGGESVLAQIPVADLSMVPGIGSTESVASRNLNHPVI
jgi:hypothetical protein